MFTKIAEYCKNRRLRKARQTTYAKYGAAHMSEGERQRIFRNRRK
jgi:hypothetical protein